MRERIGGFETPRRGGGGCMKMEQRWSRKPRNANSHKMLGETKTGSSPTELGGVHLDFGLLASRAKRISSCCF